MYATNLIIRNLRCLKEVSIPLDEVTVLVGPNNAGKTSVIEALRNVLGRRWGKRGTGFTEKDIRVPDDKTDPKTCPPIEVEVEFAERANQLWSQDIKDELFDVIQPDVITGLARISLKMIVGYDSTKQSFETSFSFINAQGQPLSVKGRGINFTSAVFDLSPVFYLGALRDIADQFTDRSPLWGRLLRAMEIPQQLETELQKEMEALNTRLLGADERMAHIAATIGGLNSVLSSSAQGAVNIRAIPTSSLDVLAKSEVYLKRSEAEPALPLAQHGQGVQSLSIIFLFSAFVQLHLASQFGPEATPVLALEEPEAHLHPQAARSLYRQIMRLAGQRIIATHSPYFLQHVPFQSIRLLRPTGAGTVVSYLKPDLRLDLPINDALKSAARELPDLLEVDTQRGQLVIKKPVSENVLKKLFSCFTDQTTRNDIHAKLRKSRDASVKLLSQTELSKLETSARRIRGEIFFARRWLIVEGQTEYCLLHAFSRSAGVDLDAEGTAVIDAQNSGSPNCIAALAEAFDIPWAGLFDGDNGGKNILRALANQGFSDAQLKQRCILLPEEDIEHFLLSNGFQEELRAIAKILGATDDEINDDRRLIKTLQDDGQKTAYSILLSQRLDEASCLVKDTPKLILEFLGKLND